MIFKKKIIVSFALIMIVGIIIYKKNNDRHASLEQQLQTVLLPYKGNLVLKNNGINYTDAEIQLGKQLFFSKSLSGNNDVACATCHHPLLAGADQLSLAVGESALKPDLIGKGRLYNWEKSLDPNASPIPNIPRNSPTTFNSSLYQTSLFWDGRVFLDSPLEYKNDIRSQKSPDSRLGQTDLFAGNTLLETQTRFPITSSQEMLGFETSKSHQNIQIRKDLIKKLRHIKNSQGQYIWRNAFQKTFPFNKNSGGNAITLERFQQAIAAYQSSQILINTPWQSYVNGDKYALSDQQKRGAILFFSNYSDNGGNCMSCHTPPFFTDEKFHNLAIPQFGRGKNANQEDFGHYLVTRKEQDRFSFRTPSLINVEHTAPYFHTGSHLTLRQSINHHLNPLRSLSNFSFLFAENTQLKPFNNYLSKGKSLSVEITKHFSSFNKIIQPAILSPNEVDDIVYFLKSLTDPCINTPNCLKQWLPDENQPTLAFQLKAITASDLPTPIISQQKSKKSYTYSSDEKTPSSNLRSSIEHKKRCKKTVGQEQETSFFTLLNDSTGLVHKHEIDPSIFNLLSLQRLIFSGGAAAGDINQDCMPDIYLSTGDQSTDKIYINQGNLHFNDMSEAWGISDIELSNGAVFADLDGDGNIDLLTTNIFSPKLSPISGTRAQSNIIKNTVYRNINNRTFELWPEYSIYGSNAIWSLALADIDNDTDLDLLSTHWQFPTPSTNHIWINDLNSFTPINKNKLSGSLIGSNDTSWTGTFSDINNDGNIDLLLASDFEQSQVFINLNGKGFSKDTLKHNLTDQNAMGSAVADYDNDGDFDWFVTSVHDPSGIKKTINNWDISGNRLYQNNNGTFKDVTDATGVKEGGWGWGACFADFNNDGWQDIFMTNGFALPENIKSELLNQSADYKNLFDEISKFSEQPNKLFISNHDGTFAEQANTFGITASSEGRAVICTDFDRDGDVDILISNNLSTPQLFRNNLGSKKNFINIKLKGSGKNSEAIGAKVFVRIDNKQQLQAVSAGGGYLSGSPAELHFGLGSKEVVDEIEIHWPKPSDIISITTNVPANQFILIEEP